MWYVLLANKRHKKYFLAGSKAKAKIPNQKHMVRQRHRNRARWQHRLEEINLLKQVSDLQSAKQINQSGFGANGTPLNMLKH